MVDCVSLLLKPEVHTLFPPPREFEGMWKTGGLYRHQYAALITDSKFGRIHAPTGTGKSRAASFFAVGPFHRHKAERIQATFAYPTNILTKHQFEEGLISGLIDNLGYHNLETLAWSPTESPAEVQYQRLRIPSEGELIVVKLTGNDLASLLSGPSPRRGKADLLQEFLDWLNSHHNFLICSPDLIAYAAHEQYGSSSLRYHNSVKRRVHSLLRGKTLVLDEYHQYDPFTLINLERLLEDERLAPERVLLLSATKRSGYFPNIPEEIKPPPMPSPLSYPDSPRIASREIRVEFVFDKDMPLPKPVTEGLTVCIYNSVIQNRQVCQQLRRMGVRLLQWDGTRKDDCPKDEPGRDIHLVLGTSAIEVGLDLDADMLLTEWSPTWMRPEQLTQRIGRVGRREKELPARAEIFVRGALEDHVRKPLSSLNGRAITKDCLNEFLTNLFGYDRIDRSSYVSYYYSEDGRKKLERRQLLQPNEELRYSFRPPGSQALFLDKTDDAPFLFLYEKAPMINRYETRPPTPDEIAHVDDGWRNVCSHLHIDIESGADFLVIVGEKARRGWLQTPTGNLEDLSAKNLRKYYIGWPHANRKEQFL
jgi:hypothetical protein